MKLNEKEIASLKKRIRKTGSCWIWTGADNKTYGVFTFRRQLMYAHRFMWSLHNKKKIQKGMEICHRCDVPKCVNPRHLFIASHKSNFLDAKIKGRMASGKRHGSKTKPNCFKRGKDGRWLSRSIQKV